MRFLIAALSVAALLVSANAAKADKRVAFVVGNGAYKNVAALPNPAVDAKSMAKLLRNVGFDVVEGANLTRDKMTERCWSSARRPKAPMSRCSSMAGHGIAVNGSPIICCRSMPTSDPKWTSSWAPPSMSTSRSSRP